MRATAIRYTILRLCKASCARSANRWCRNQFSWWRRSWMRPQRARGSKRCENLRASGDFRFLQFRRRAEKEFSRWCARLRMRWRKFRQERERARTRVRKKARRRLARSFAEIARHCRGSRVEQARRKTAERDCDIWWHVRPDSLRAHRCSGSSGAAVRAAANLFCSILASAAQKPAAACAVLGPLRDGGAGVLEEKRFRAFTRGGAARIAGGGSVLFGGYGRTVSTQASAPEHLLYCGRGFVFGDWHVEEFSRAAGLVRFHHREPSRRAHRSAARSGSRRDARGKIIRWRKIAGVAKIHGAFADDGG